MTRTTVIRRFLRRAAFVIATTAAISSSILCVPLRRTVPFVDLVAPLVGTWVLYQPGTPDAVPVMQMEDPATGDVQVPIWMELDVPARLTVQRDGCFQAPVVRARQQITVRGNREVLRGPAVDGVPDTRDPLRVTWQRHGGHVHWAVVREGAVHTLSPGAFGVTALASDVEHLLPLIRGAVEYGFLWDVSSSGLVIRRISSIPDARRVLINSAWPPLDIRHYRRVRPSTVRDEGAVRGLAVPRMADALPHDVGVQDP